jgi:hypothetical protein
MRNNVFKSVSSASLKQFRTFYSVVIDLINEFNISIDFLCSSFVFIEWINFHLHKQMSAYFTI